MVEVSSSGGQSFSDQSALFQLQRRQEGPYGGVGTSKEGHPSARLILYLKQLKFEINSLVMFLKEMNLQILALLFQDLPEI